MSDYPPNYEPEEPTEVECKECAGNGWIEARIYGRLSEVICHACNGTGLVPNEQFSDWMQDQIRFKRNRY